MLGDRYRIVNLLGRGGMGEVYRADDLKLDQPVALKFLSERMEQDKARLARFLLEVKIARNISHPNVCRVYDIGEVDGQHFISMEFIDGEDLASLLRRIGRLPRAKAIEIGQQICHGLAAAHQQGILHRDLKPANLMLDSQGRARITDFGLASLAEGLSGSEARCGTPAYMAPEQHAGRQISIESDLYALGLVLYKLLTGRSAFTATTAAEWARQHRTQPPPLPSTWVEDLDPALEGVVMQCLEKHPGDRPPSALAIAEALAADEGNAGGPTAQRLTGISRTPANRSGSSASPAVAAARQRRHRRLLVLLGVIALGLLLVWLSRVEPRRRLSAPTMADQATLATISSPRRSVAVLTFANPSANPELDWLQTAMPEVLSAKLGLGAEVRVIERQEVGLMELDLQIVPQGQPATGEMRRIGDYLAAQHVIAGALEAEGGNTAIRLSLRLFDAQSGEQIFAAEKAEPLAAWFDLVNRASGVLADRPGLRQALGASALDQELMQQLEASFPTRGEAARLYAEGLVHRRRFDVRQAQDRFTQAVAQEAHPRLYSALAEAQFFLGFRQAAQQTLGEATERARKLAAKEQLELALQGAKIARDPGKVLELSEELFRTHFPDDLSRGLGYVAALADAGDPESALLVIDELRRLVGRDHPRLSLARADSLFLRGEHDQALETARRAAAEAHQEGAIRLAAQAKLLMASIATDIGDDQQAQRLYRQAQQGFEQLGDRRGQAQCLELTARLYSDNDLALARSLLSEAIELYETVGGQRDRVRALFTLSGVAMAQGEAAEALHMAEEARTLAQDLWFSFDDGYDFALSGYYHHLAGRLEEARQQYESAAEIFSKADERDDYAVMLTNLGEIEYMRGHFAQAQELHLLALRDHEADGASLDAAYDLFRSGRAYAAAGDEAVARDRYAKALARQENLDNGIPAAETRLAIAELDLMSGDLARSLAAATESEQVLRIAGRIDLQVYAEAIRARTLLALGQTQQARQALAAARALAVGITDFRSRYALAIAEARYEAATGAADKALTSLRQLTAEAAAAQHVVYEFEMLLAMGEIELAAGRSAVGRERLQALEHRARQQGFLQMARRALAALA